MNTPAPLEMSITVGVPAEEVRGLIAAGVCERLSPDHGFVYPERVTPEIINAAPIIKMALGRVMTDKTFGNQSAYRIAMNYAMSAEAAILTIVSRNASVADIMADGLPKSH